MGRPRKHNKHLPAGMRLSHGAYYRVTPEKWTHLGRQYHEALLLFAKLEIHRYAGELVSDMVTRFMLEVAPGKSKATFIGYAAQSRVLMEVFGAMRIRDVRPTHIAQFLDARPAKVQAAREVALLSSMFSQAMRWGWCDTNPCRGIRKPGSKKRRRYLTPDERKALADTLPANLRELVPLAYLTALRKADLLALRWADVSQEGIRVRPAKTENRTGETLLLRRGPLLDEVLARLEHRRRTRITAYLFPNGRGERYTTSGFDSVWRRAIARSGVADARFHDLRRTRLVDVSRAEGKDAAQRLAGHASVQTTEIYTDGVLPTDVYVG